LQARRGGWDWFDHQGHQDQKVMENCWYYAALKAAREMGRLVGHDRDRGWLEERIKSIETGFDRAFWRPGGYCDRVTDERANALAVVFGLAGKDKYPDIQKVLTSQAYCTPYMEAYVLEALFMMGYTDDAYIRMKQRYQGMVEADVSTLWEDFSKWGTLNHAWSGAPLMLMCKYGAGIAPTAPGWKRFSVLPRPGPLKKMKVTVPSVMGDIGLVIDRSDDCFELTLESPEGTTAVVGIPKELFPGNSVSVNKTMAWKDGAFVKHAEATGRAGDEDGFLRFPVGQGTWVFDAR
jgi:hypothetical protein